MKRVYLVDYAKCSYNSCGRPCITYCPVELTNKQKRKKRPVKVYPAIDFKKSSNQIIIHEEICIRCGICINKCPKNAVFVKNFVEEDKSKNLIHKYRNIGSLSGFRLYNLPTLVSGRVTGLCGANGIGKSTLMNILSANLKPNFGEFLKEDNKESWNKIANKIKDNDIRNHYLDFARGNRKISYKPQVLNVLFKEFKGKTVKQILDKENSVDEEFKKLVFEALDITKISDRYLEQCSGGELQRFAITLFLINEADVYLIDEPCTFLDVKKRIKLAETFQKRSKSNGNRNSKSVLVVEHDLTILDYMSDVIHLFYGEPHQFGVITRVQPVKRGINSYLNGQLKTENLQFRSNQIKFRKTISGRTWSNALKLVEWSNIEKLIGNFKLNINSGWIYQNEILGVVGENGLGKTTFFKILLGMIQPDVGELNLLNKFSLSYKPQYITPSYNGTVEQFIMDYSKKYIHTEDLKTKLYEPLGIENLFQNKLSTLSGGQLQRSFIAACLTKDANIYLIDEPSAYLDIEERLKIAEIIRSHTKSVNAGSICIEHDIQIMDSLADRLLIFSGDPGLNGNTIGPLNKRDGMNKFLKSLDVTFRRDEETGRARINKKDSKLDKQQRRMGEYYYVKLQ